MSTDYTTNIDYDDFLNPRTLDLLGIEIRENNQGFEVLYKNGNYLHYHRDEYNHIAFTRYGSNNPMEIFDQIHLNIPSVVITEYWSYA